MSATLAFLTLAEAVGAPNPGLLDAMMATFASVCVEQENGLAQRRAAEALPDVSKEVRSDYDREKRQQRVPGALYTTPTMRLGIMGYKGASLCYVVTNIEPSIDPAAYRSLVAARFGGKASKQFAADDLYRGSWNSNGRTFEIEWKRKDDGVLALLSIRKRDGFAK